MGAMPNTSQPLKGAELRKAVAEWTANGCSVKIGADGSIDITPPARDIAGTITDYDKADMKL